MQLKINSLDHTRTGSSQCTYQYNHMSSVPHRAGKRKLNQHKPSFLQSQYNDIHVYTQKKRNISSILFHWTEWKKNKGLQLIPKNIYYAWGPVVYKHCARCVRSSERAATPIYHEEYDDRAQQHPGRAGGGVAQIRPHGILAGRLQYAGENGELLHAASLLR